MEKRNRWISLFTVATRCSDPLTKVGARKSTYQIPTYQAQRGFWSHLLETDFDVGYRAG